VVTTRFQHLLWPQLGCLLLGTCLIIGSFAPRVLPRDDGERNSVDLTALCICVSCHLVTVHEIATWECDRSDVPRYVEDSLSSLCRVLNNYVPERSYVCYGINFSPAPYLQVSLHVKSFSILNILYFTSVLSEISHVCSVQ